VRVRTEIGKPFTTAAIAAGATIGDSVYLLRRWTLKQPCSDGALQATLGQLLPVTAPD